MICPRCPRNVPMLFLTRLGDACEFCKAEIERATPVETRPQPVYPRRRCTRHSRRRKSRPVAPREHSHAAAARDYIANEQRRVSA